MRVSFTLLAPGGPPATGPRIGHEKIPGEATVPMPTRTSNAWRAAMAWPLSIADHRVMRSSDI